jgi:threonylcarbamoyladenosine tRNA methylthiotransferase MtaB
VKSEADFYVEVIRLVTERAFLKVQDGCDYKCTYCTIPLAEEFHEVMSGKCVEKCKDISDQNIKEIVLTGVNIDYGRGIWKQETRTYILELVQELDKVEGIERL